jgi:hypothetical protein
MRVLCALTAAAALLMWIAPGAVCQETGDAHSEPPQYELTAAAILVDLREQTPSACAIVEVRNRSLQPIDRVEIFSYSKELADGIVSSEISSESLDSPEPLPRALFSRPQISEDNDGRRRLYFRLSRDLEPADATWVLIMPADGSAPLVTSTRSGAELKVESPSFARDVVEMVVGLVAGAQDTVEFRPSGAGRVRGSMAYDNALLTSQIAALSRLLGAAASMWDREPVASWPAAAYFSGTPAGERRIVQAIYVSPEGGTGVGDRRWIFAAATLAGGGVIIAVLVALGRRSRSKGAADPGS